MATAEELMALIGQPVNLPKFQQLIASDELSSETEPDLEEGVEILTHLSNHSRGYELSIGSGRIKTAFLHVEGNEQFAGFCGDLPFGLSRNATRREVLARMGKPEWSREAKTVSLFGPRGAADRFFVNSMFVHFEYHLTKDCVVLVTIMSAESAPKGG